MFTTNLDNQDEDVRYYAVMGLWQILGEEGSIAPLIGSLKDDDEEVRALAAEVLADLMIEEAIEPLIHATNDVSDKVRENAKWALSKLRTRYKDTN